jgi:DNA-binding HxlR family transcriptional regulator
MKDTRLNKATCIPSIKLLGDYWSLRIIDELSRGEKRFCSLQRELDNLNPVTLTSRLKKLEKAKIIKRNAGTLDKLSVTYELTDLGLNVLPVINAVNEFSIKSN